MSWLDRSVMPTPADAKPCWLQLIRSVLCRMGLTSTVAPQVFEYIHHNRQPPQTAEEAE